MSRILTVDAAGKLRVYGEPELANNEKQATPHADLIAQILDSRVPKNEREWAAAREIEALTARLANLKRLIIAAQTWREFQYLDSVIDQTTDVRLRTEAELARQSLLTAIDNLENE
jgi:hypothetical protein